MRKIKTYLTGFLTGWLLFFPCISSAEAVEPFENSSTSFAIEKDGFYMTVANITVGAKNYWIKWKLDEKLGWKIADYGEYPPVTEDFRMVTPYVTESDMASINEAFSSDASAPWGFAHGGIDFFPAGKFKPFRAVFDGVVGRVDKFFNTGNSNWQVNVDIKYSSTYRAGYAFEPMSGSETDGDIQRDAILVEPGQAVRQGEIIGYLYAAKEGTHVHFSLYENHTPICPEAFFNADARNSILNLIRKTYPEAEICH